jgi:hypothetical protein
VAASLDDAIVTRFLHGRDCLGDEPTKRSLAATFKVHRTKVDALVDPHGPKGVRKAPSEPSLNGSGPA